MTSPCVATVFTTMDHQEAAPWWLRITLTQGRRPQDGYARRPAGPEVLEVQSIAARGRSPARSCALQCAVPRVRGSGAAAGRTRLWPEAASVSRHATSAKIEKPKSGGQPGNGADRGLRQLTLDQTFELPREVLEYSLNNVIEPKMQTYMCVRDAFGFAPLRMHACVYLRHLPWIKACNGIDKLSTPLPRHSLMHRPPLATRAPRGVSTSNRPCRPSRGELILLPVLILVRVLAPILKIILTLIRILILI